MMQLSFAFLDPTVMALISTSISITHYDGLPATVASATADQLRHALELLPASLRRGRGPVLEFALRKLGA